MQLRWSSWPGSIIFSHLLPTLLQLNIDRMWDGIFVEAILMQVCTRWIHYDVWSLLATRPGSLGAIGDWQSEKKRRNSDRRAIYNSTRCIHAWWGLISHRGHSDCTDWGRPLWPSHSTRTEMYFGDAAVEDHMIRYHNHCVQCTRACVWNSFLPQSENPCIGLAHTQNSWVNTTSFAAVRLKPVSPTLGVVTNIEGFSESWNFSCISVYSFIPISAYK